MPTTMTPDHARAVLKSLGEYASHVETLLTQARAALDEARAAARELKLEINEFSADAFSADVVQDGDDG